MRKSLTSVVSMEESPGKSGSSSQTSHVQKGGLSTLEHLHSATPVSGI